MLVFVAGLRKGREGREEGKRRKEGKGRRKRKEEEGAKDAR